MKKKHLIPISIAACFGFSLTSNAQDIHPALKNVASKISTDGEHMSMTKIDGDIGTLKQYLDVILNIARSNGESIPKNLNAKELFKVTGIDTLRATGRSAQELDNAWINHSYLENTGSHSGIFSFIGKTNQEHVAAHIFPDSTDLALQLQIDLKQLAPMIIEISRISGKKSIKSKLEETIPELNMTPSEILSKLNVTANLAVDINTDKDSRANPLAVIANANAIVRLDGITWVWDKIGDRIIQKSKLPLEKTEDAAGTITYTVPDEMQDQLMGYKPQVIIDKVNDHIWITSNTSFYEKCKSNENKLADSPAFKAAMEKLPNKANSMMYLSKGLLLTAQDQYKFAVSNNMFGSEFIKGKEFIDRLMQDVTESDKGWAMVLNKDEHGVMLASRGPLGIHHLDYLQMTLPYMLVGFKSIEPKKEK